MENAIVLTEITRETISLNTKTGTKRERLNLGIGIRSEKEIVLREKVEKNRVEIEKDIRRIIHEINIEMGIIQVETKGKYLPFYIHK